MPNRIIKDSINESRGLTSCSFFAQDLYKRLITYADDYGRFNADPQIMVARLYPRELAVVSIEDLTEGLVELVGVQKIKFYTSSARKEVYGCFPHWEEHQRIRDSKKKIPDPEDTTVNDWYLRRYIPAEMKVAIVQRDGFKCKECGKHIAEITDASKLVKMASGCFHIDHIVPCNQGGRATMENLRLLCPKCNQSRKKTFSYDEILNFSGETGNSAVDCGELPQSAPVIQSNTNPNTNPNTNSAPARADIPAQREKYGQYGWVRLTQEEYSKLLTDLGEAELRRCIEYVDESAQGNGNKNRWKDWNLVIRKCHRDGWGLNRQGKPKQIYSSYTGHEGPTEEEYQRMQKMLKDFGGDDGETEDLPFA